MGCAECMNFTLVAVERSKPSVHINRKAEEVHTYSTAVWSSSDDVVLKLEIRVEYIGVELDFTVELIANLPPVGYGCGHIWMSLA